MVRIFMLLTFLLSSSAFSCGPIEINDHSRTVKMDLSDPYRGYTKEVVEGVAYSLFASEKDFDFTDNEDEFFKLVEEMELFRKSNEGRRLGDFYIAVKYALGEFEVDFSEEAKLAIEGLPFTGISPRSEEGRGFLKGYHTVNGGTGVTALDEMFKKYGTEKVYVYRLSSESLLMQTKIWTNPNTLLAKLKASPAGDFITDGRRNGSLCFVDVTIRWVSPSVYSYTNPDSPSDVRYYRVDVKANEVNEIDAP